MPRISQCSSALFHAGNGDLLIAPQRRPLLLTIEFGGLQVEPLE
jgi:homogentisate 1,2-dioxygenase